MQIKNIFLDQFQNDNFRNHVANSKISLILSADQRVQEWVETM